MYRYLIKSSCALFINKVLISFSVITLLLQGCSTPSILVTREQQQGDYYNNQNNYEQAIIHYKKSLEASARLGIYRNPLMESQLCRKIAHANQAAGNYNAALIYINMAIEIDSLHNHHLQLIEDYRESGKVYIMMGDIKKGVSQLEYSLSMSEGMETTTLKRINKKIAADNRMVLANAYLTLGMYNQSLANSRIAMSLYENIDHIEGQAEANLTLGSIYTDLGDVYHAENLLNYSVRQAEECGFQTARQYQTLGEVSELKGEYETALRHKLKALEEAEKANILPQILWATVSVGDAYKKIGDAEHAAVYYKKALHLRKVKDIQSQSMEASLDMRLDNFLAARSYFTDAGILTGSGLVSMRLAEAKAMENDTDSALVYYKEAESYFRQAGNKEGIANALLRIADFLVDQNKLKDADSGLSKVPGLSSNPELLWQVWYHRGRIHEKTGMPDSAIVSYKRSIEIIESIREKFTIEEFKSIYMDNKIDVYDRLIQLLIKQKRESEAFYYSERARARAFLDMLGNKKPDIRKGADKEFIEKEQLLSTRMQQLKKQIQKSLLDLYDDETMRTMNVMLNKELERTQAEYNEVLLQLKLMNSSYSALISIEPANLEKIQSTLDESTALLEYWVGQELTIIWIVTKKTFSFFPVNFTSKQMTDIVLRCRKAISSQKEIKNESLASLNEAIIQPVESVLNGYTSIGIIPHGPLHFLPFQALVDKEGKFLIEKKQIFYAPSSTVYLQCKEKTPDRGENFLGMALGDIMIGTFFGLPGTSREVDAISAFYTEKTIKKNRDISEDFFKQEAEKFNIIHLATHGYFNKDQPMYSYLLLHPSEINDGHLTVHEVFGMDLRTRLVILSACQTGLGDISRGDELVGLSRAFIYAGTPSIIVSLWSLADEPTAELMIQFHKYLKTKPAPEALTLAQREMIKNFKHPYYWAPFVLIGQ
ncbi:MAG: CHAT domain-containing protein [Bacteroidales bacterium]|nr:MAG: CHAT domain-containing protein [Bacteroidales bacterium]